MPKTFKLIYLLLLLSFSAIGFETIAYPQQQPQKTSKVQVKPANRTLSSTASRDLNFDDSLIEGMKNNSLDSLEMMERSDKRKKTHLYWKRQGYKRELRAGAKEMEFQP